jgi:hypothetical protein
MMRRGTATWQAWLLLPLHDRMLVLLCIRLLPAVRPCMLSCLLLLA